MVDKSTNTDISGDILPLNGNVLNPSEISQIKTEPQSVDISDCIPKSPPSEDSIENVLFNSQSMERLEDTKPSNSTDLTLSEEELNTSDQEINKRRKKHRKVPNFCIYCETDVLNFARHLRRVHYSEPEVTKIFSIAIKSPERRHLITALRKKGNFVKNLEACQKPVRRGTGVKCVPCKHCLGFYSSKFLYRHVKRCKSRKHPSTSYSHLTDAHNLLLMNKQVDRELVKTVFPKMLADDISFEAKSDTLICMFGARYLKTHKEKHFVNVCSRKMREIARLLIEIKKQKPSIKSLFDAFRPENFQFFVQGTKVVAKYDPDTDRFETPSYAVNIHSSLNHCCDIAIATIARKNQMGDGIPDLDTEKDYKAFKQLLEDAWRFDVAAKICDAPKSQRTNKIPMVSLVQGVKDLTEFLEREGDKAYAQLETEDSNLYAYRTLMEIVFCRLLLLNRMRAERLEKILLSRYTSKDTSLNEDFSNFITLTEGILLKKFKKVVLRDTQCRDIPIIFTSELQKHTDKLLELRTNFVAGANVYLFVDIGTNDHIEGHKVFKRHCCRSEVKNYKILMSKKLRKHLATVSQLFTMSNYDLEQLQTYMERTHAINRQGEIPPIDVQQAAKISKILLLVDKGKTQELRGKTIDEIDVVLDVDSEDEDSEKHEEPEVFNEPKPPPIEKKKEKIFRKKIPWTDKQKSAAKSFFSHHIANKKPPKKKDIEELRIKYKNLFDNKTWPQIKVFVQNIYTKMT